jgi:hypothetical protein
MNWTKDNQIQLDGLRQKELAGTLTEPEQVELAGLMAQVEADEARALAPAMDRLRADIGESERELSAVQSKNEELAHLLAQQEALGVTDRGTTGTTRCTPARRA